MTQPSMRPPFPPPQPPPLMPPGYARPPRRSVVPLVTGALGMVAAGLALGGSFAPVREVQSGSNGYAVKWWGVERPEVTANTDTLAGLTLVLATLLLGVGAVAAFTRVTAAARLFLALGVGSLTGTVVLQLIYTLDDMALWNDVPLEPGQTVRFTTGWGLWLPLAAVVFGVVAVVLAYRGGPTPGGPARVEPNTPRMGFPMPYGPPTGTQPPILPTGVTPPGAVPAGMVAAGAAMAAPTPPVAAPALAAPGPPIPAGPPMAAPPAAVPVPAAAAPPVPPSTSDDPDETLRTTVSDGPTEAPAPAAVVPEPPAAAEIANALTPAPVAPDAQTEVPPAESAEWTAADVDTPPEPAPEAADAPTEVPPADPAPVPVSTPPGAAAAQAAQVAAEPAGSEPAPETPATDAEATDEEEREPAATESAASEAAPTDPEPDASGLAGLPAAPPAPELAAEQAKDH